MTSAGTLKDAYSIASLLSLDAPQDHSLRYRDRQLQYLTPRNAASYGVSSGAIISFDTSTLVNAWTDLSEAFLAVPLTITTSAMTQVEVGGWPNLAFKSSALSLFNRIVVKTSSGQVLCDEVDTGAFADHLRLAFEKDQSWLKLVAPAIHYYRDSPPEGTVGLYLDSQISAPCTSRFSAPPAAGGGVGGTDGNGCNYNPAYNIGHHQRNMALMRSTYTSTGTTTTAVGNTAFTCSLNIPISVMHDFFRQLSFPLTGVNLSFDFYLSPTGANPAGVGVMNPFVIGSTDFNPQVQDAGGLVSMMVVANAELPTPRLYYHAVTLQPEASAIMSQRLAEGFTKTISWRRYEIKKSDNYLQNVPSGSTTTVPVNQSANAPRRLWLMAYPAQQINTNEHPSVLVTGANGFNSIQMIVNGKQLYNNPLMTLAEQYDELKQAMHLGASGDPEALLPYDDFRLVSRIHCLDLTRLAGRLSDPNAPVSLQLQYQVLCQSSKVDVVILLESEYTATISFSTGKVGITVGPSTYQ